MRYDHLQEVMCCLW